ncbi:MAG TPA: hypothetical protein VN843_20670 [Anaerolineales bacterium]|nr:hypothetical protein [Anaerolineales bacterium]
MKFRIDDFRANTEWMMQTLSLYYQTIEQAMAENRRLNRVNIDARSIESQDDFDDYQEELDQFKLIHEEDFTSKVRYTFVSLTYSIFEERAKALCQELKTRKIIMQELEEKPRGGFVAGLKRFFPHGYMHQTMRRELDDLRLIRNCLVHSNGRPDNVRSDYEQVSRVLEKNRSLSLNQEGYIHVGPEYCIQIVSLVKDFFNAIFERAGFGPAETVEV